ncbi:hypothetical protein VTK73DRAFT_3353 [Phialemonium thermophilum]|uniref:TRUD domain-containing protein n=1 Tax=Phialemonium thermophilum TaxID=223376 RepID=A0ABR3WZT1_9PEZI
MNTPHQGTHVPAVRAALERQLGITERSSPVDYSWIADIRKRFTDFLVYEIRKDGTVIHLNDFEEPPQKIARKQISNESTKPHSSNDATGKEPALAAEEGVPDVKPPVHISDADRLGLEGLLGQVATDQLVEFDLKIQTKKLSPQERAAPLQLVQVRDRDKRGNIHKEIRRIFSSRIETTTDKDGFITATPSQFSLRVSRSGSGRGPREDSSSSSSEAFKSFAQLGGEYLHFTLYKENRDTMEALNLIARMLKIKVQNFGFSGTKDRRAATVQRISIYRQRAHNLTWLNPRMSGVKVGDFKHSKYPVQLGQHGGNEFIITLKNCEHYRGGNCSVPVRIKMIRESVEMGLLHLYKHGFINYYGLQRFGTHSIGTHQLGMKILKGNFEGAVEDILHVEPQYMTDALSDHARGPPHGHAHSASHDEYKRAWAIATFKATGNADRALEHMPKRFGAETSIIRHLSRASNRHDYMGALLTITRGLRQMYIHAYQSFVWNFVATYRWAKYGPRVIEGDIIMVDIDKPRPYSIGDDDIQEPSADWEDFYAQVRPLTAKDIESGTYTIFDIVLPTPGFDVTYPVNDVGDYYKTFMARPENGGLNPCAMRRRQREFSLSGSYRPLVSRFMHKPEYLVRAYSDDNEQMYPTDLDLVLQKKAEAKAEHKRKLETSVPVASLWNNFARNPAEFDRADNEEIRRRLDELPPPDAGNIRSTWAETGLDRDAKRIKIARHDPDTIPSQPTESQVVKQADDVLTAALSGPSGNDTGALESSKGFGAQQETLGNRAGNQPSLAQEGKDFLLSLLRSNGLSAESDGSLPSDPQKHQDLRGVDNNSAVDSAGLIINSKDPKPLALTVPSAGLVKSGQDTQPAQQTHKQVRKPPLRQISENPILAFAPEVHPDDEQVTTGDKIAVILKFQLPSSSYATIVLRELMGSIREESNRESRGTTPSSGSQTNQHR